MELKKGIKVVLRGNGIDKPIAEITQYITSKDQFVGETLEDDPRLLVWSRFGSCINISGSESICYDVLEAYNDGKDDYIKELELIILESLDLLPEQFETRFNDAKNKFGGQS